MPTHAPRQRGASSPPFRLLKFPTRAGASAPRPSPEAPSRLPPACIALENLLDDLIQEQEAEDDRARMVRDSLIEKLERLATLNPSAFRIIEEKIDMKLTRL